MPAKKQPKLKNTQSTECVVCETPRPRHPRGHVLPLPFEWSVHTIRDDRYEKGYCMVITCSVWCRLTGGYD